MSSQFQELRREASTLLEVAKLSPLAATLAAGAIAKGTFYNALHLDTQSSGVTLFEWTKELERHRLIDRRTASTLHRLRQWTNECRHQGKRPSTREARSLVKDLNHLIDDLTSLSILARCSECGSTAQTIRLRLSKYFGQPAPAKPGRCPRCKSPLTVPFDWIREIQRDSC